ncbi:MAG: hypothetical protein WD342_13740 [Verrucomicrobiales bacterium]
MNRLFPIGLSCLVAVLLASCASNEKVSVGGVAGWVADGAKLDKEPPPRKPDAAVAVVEDESDPVSFSVVTDRRPYPNAPVKRVEAPSTDDPLERGRDYRIKRLVR